MEMEISDAGTLADSSCEPLETELEEAVTSLLHEIPIESRQSLIATAILVLESEAEPEENRVYWISNSTSDERTSQSNLEESPLQDRYNQPSANEYQEHTYNEQAHENHSSSSYYQDVSAWSLKDDSKTGWGPMPSTCNIPHDVTSGSHDDFRWQPSETIKEEPESYAAHRRLPSMMDDLRRKQSWEKEQRKMEKQKRTAASIYAAALSNVNTTAIEYVEDGILLKRHADSVRMTEIVSSRRGRKRKHEDEDEEQSCVEHSAAKKAKIEEEDVNNNVDMSQLVEKYNICPKTGKFVDVSQLAEKYNICPKTGKLFPKSQVRMLSAQHRRMKLRKQPSLFVQTVRRNMILQAIDTRSYCCMKQCFKKEHRL